MLSGLNVFLVFVPVAWLLHFEADEQRCGVGYKDEGEGWRELGRERVDTIDPDGRPSPAIDSDPKS